ncbi:Hepatitis A virus cellular receptor 1, partial [Pristimantis euphronides]
MGMYTLLLTTLTLLTPGLVSAYRSTGVVGDNVILPCLNPVLQHTSVACWGRGPCSSAGCNYPIASINGSKVIWTKSMKYQVNGDIAKGDLPLTITDATLDDSGVYCCRVRINSLGIDLKREINVEIQHPMMPDNLVRGSVDQTLTLPCKYSTSEGPREVCWGKGSCPISSCKNKVITTDGTEVTWAESHRYKLLGNITKGDASLTISELTKDLEGTYCCRVRIPGIFNDIKNEIKLEIQDVNLVKGSLKESLVLPCSYDTDGGTYRTCWGRGHCGLLLCLNEIVTSDGNDMDYTSSSKYQLTGNIAKGNVALTIKDVNADDGGRVKLPCKYNVSEGTSPMCWGRDACPKYKCSNTIVWTDGDEVSWTESEKYKLIGDLKTGDVSLTINDLKKEDEGMYCCRVEIPGLFNDKMMEINLDVEDIEYAFRPSLTVECGLGTSVLENIKWMRRALSPFFFNKDTITWILYLDMLRIWHLPQLEQEIPGFIFQQDGVPPPLSQSEASSIGNYQKDGLATLDKDVTGSVNDTLTLPCTYTVDKDQYSFCWGRGKCPLWGCYDIIVKTDGNKVTEKRSNRYHLLGNIRQGDVSLTITGATKEDEGTYCCRVNIPGLFNDLKKGVKVEIGEGETLDTGSHI